MREIRRGATSSMRWRKLGRIIGPNPEIPWMSTSAGSTYVKVRDGELRIHMSGRDKSNITRIGVVDVDLRDMRSIIRVSPGPVLDIGEPGCFDESGVSY